MTLAELRAFIGNLTDYTPSVTNEASRAQIDELINDAQGKILAGRAWDFAQREDRIDVLPDATYTVTATNGSITVSGTGFPISASVTNPGSVLDGRPVIIDGQVYTIAWCSSSTNVYLTTPFTGSTGTYSAVVQFRDVYLPADTATLMAVIDPSNGSRLALDGTSKSALDITGIGRLQSLSTGTPTSYMPSEGYRIPAPNRVIGASVTTPGAGQGVRTITVYMVNVWGFGSVERESALSPGLTFNLTDTQALTLTPETLPNQTGLYRRYYFTCPALGIRTPVRVVRKVLGSADVHTISPAGGVTLAFDSDVTTLTSQTFQATSIRYTYPNGMYQSFQLYPHGASLGYLTVRRLITPAPMKEDQDVPLIPAPHARVIGFVALEAYLNKQGQPQLAAIQAAQASDVVKQMEQRYLTTPQSRTFRGGGIGSLHDPGFGRNYGAIRFLP